MNLKTYPHGAHPCGAIKRQIDYIMVNRKYRDCVRKAYAIPAWRANQEQQRHHDAIKMEIRIRLKKQYFETPKHGAGNEVEYNLKRLRAEPQLLEQHCKTNQIQFQYQSNQGVATNWGKMKKTTQDSLNQVYPIYEKGNGRKIWQQKGFDHATEPEKTQYQTLTQDRQKHMKAIVNIDKKVRNLSSKTRSAGHSLRGKKHTPF